MKLNKLYTKYYFKFSKKNMINLSDKYTKNITIHFRLFIFYASFAFFLMMSADRFKTNSLNIQGGFLLIAIAAIILSVLYLKRYKKALKDNFITHHNLSDKDTINYIYYDLLEELKDDKNFINHRNKLIEIADLEIENEKNSYLQSPITVLSISFIMAIFVNKMTAEAGLAAITLSLIVLIMISCLFFYYLYFESKSHKMSNHIEFKRFILNTKYQAELP